MADGWIEKRGTRYRAGFRDDSGNKHTRTFDTKGEAERWKRAELRKLDTGEYVDATAARHTLGEVWRLFIDSHEGRERTIEMYGSLWRVHLAPTWEHVQLRHITVPDVMIWLKKLRATPSRQTKLPLADSTVHGCWLLLHALCTFAVRKARWIGRHPLDGMQAPGFNSPEAVPPTVADVNAMLTEMPARYVPLFIVEAGAGLRYGEAAGLTRDRLDLGTGWLRVDRQVHSASKATWRWGPPKGDARSVPLSGWATGRLRAHLDAYPMIGDGFIAHEPDGNPILDRKYTYRFNRIQHELWGEQRYTPHDLRHFYVSQLLTAGVSLSKVQRYIGHRPGSPITERTYSHLIPEDHAAVREAFDSLGLV